MIRMNICVRRPKYKNFANHQALLPPVSVKEPPYGKEQTSLHLGGSADLSGYFRNYLSDLRRILYVV
jgi:hypothetical protein